MEKKIQLIDVNNKIYKEYTSIGGYSIPGNHIYLNIDHRIQNIVYQMMQQYTGACVISRPYTGEVLALYSYPSYDPNVFIGNRDIKKYNEYNNNQNKPFFNRVIMGEYPPSSLFKIITSFAALKRNFISIKSTYFCDGFTKVGSEKKRCEGIHLNQNMLQAIANSCNSYFYQLGINIGPSTIINSAVNYFKMNKKTGIDIPSEKTGRIPNEDWKLNIRKSFWWDGDTANLAIGQGFTTTTVIHMNMITAAIANNGIAFKPRLVYGIKDPINNEWIYKPEKEIFINLPITDYDLNFLKKIIKRCCKIRNS